MNKKNLIRIVVLAGLLAWPGVEWYRYQVAKNQLTASIELRLAVTERLASLRQQHGPVPGKQSEETLPVKNDGTTTGAVPKGI